MANLSGQNIISIRTLGSQFDKHRLIEATDDQGTVYRMDINEFMKIINDITFRVTEERKYRHLHIINYRPDLPAAGTAGA